jgi:hypothetical protein
VYEASVDRGFLTRAGLADPTVDRGIPSPFLLEVPPMTSPSPRRIDPRGHRFGGGLSAAILALAFGLGTPALVLAIAVALWVSAAFGTRYSILGRPWPFVRRALGIGPPAELEGEFPPRFAQAFGGVVLAFALVLFAVGATAGAWLLTGAVAALQTVLAVTGYCLGCRLYFLRWYGPALFDRLAAATSRAPSN